jgi:hypothetical protein
MTANTDYVQAYLGGLSGTVGWDSVALQLVVNDAVELYGVTLEADASDATKFKPLLRYSAARRILREASMDFNYSADGESFQRSNVSKQVADYMLNDALADALQYLPNGTSEIDSIDMGWSPYRRTTY